MFLKSKNIGTDLVNVVIGALAISTIIAAVVAFSGILSSMFH